MIRREIAVVPGDVMNTVRMEASKQRLQNLNYFDKVEIYPGDTIIPGRKDVNVIVEREAHRFVQLRRRLLLDR